MNPLLPLIRSLEVELHHPGVRCDEARLRELLHPDFHEVGRSGAAYDRATIVRFLAAQDTPPAVESGDFELAQLSPDVVLLTYRSATRRPDGTLERYTLRSSVWVRVGEQWRLRYHQGTPAPEADAES